MKLKEVIQGIEEIEVYGNLDVEITNLDSDSRKIESNGLFIAIKGFETDGHAYIKGAIQKGATAVIMQENEFYQKEDTPENVTIIIAKDTRKVLPICACNFYDNPSKKFKLIGITGTSGKTTTSFMIKKILEEQGLKVGLIGTVAIYIGNKKIEDSARTTPESIKLQKIFAQMVEEKVDVAVMEVSSQSLKLGRVLGCDFDIGVFTNFSREHISKNEHPDMEDYFNSKLKLFSMCKVAYTNIDDEKGAQLPEIVKDCAIKTFGVEKQSDIHGSNISMTNMYTKFKLNIGEKEEEIKVFLPTRFSVYNSLAAISVANELKVPLDTIKRAMEKVRVPGRSELVDNKKNMAIIIDYAHIPDSMESILKEVRQSTKGKLICIFGCGGDRDPFRRPLMGEVSGRLADLTILTQDNPRTEKTEDIIADIEVGVQKAGGKYISILDRKDAIRHAIKVANQEDTIILIGKGHETYQDINHQKIHFDEREVVREIMDEE